MKPFEELVKEVYQNAELRREFKNYVRLKSLIQEKAEGYIVDFPQLYSNSIRYNNQREENVYIKTDRFIDAAQINRNILYLSSALFRTLSQKYKLAAADTRRLRDAVADKYAHEL